MADPKFETRAELEAWALALARDALDNGGRLQALTKIKRVTLAHSHLIGEK